MKKLFLIKNPEVFQGEEHINSNASFMISIADIPFKAFRFRGIICDLIIDNKEFKFATYNNSKLIEYDVEDNTIIFSDTSKNCGMEIVKE